MIIQANENARLMFDATDSEIGSMETIVRLGYMCPHYVSFEQAPTLPDPPVPVEDPCKGCFITCFVCAGGRASRHFSFCTSSSYSIVRY
jgi:hypothetical protein